MSKLRPNYLPVMREALFQFCGAIGIFCTDHGNKPKPGSPADHELAISPCPESLATAWCKAVQLIDSGREHVAAFVRTITEPVQPIVCWTCVRSMLEPCSLASWLLDPHIDAHTRVGRVFAIRYEGIEQYQKYVRLAGGSDEHLQRIKKRLDEMERDALKLGYSCIINKSVNGLGLVRKCPRLRKSSIGCSMRKKCIACSRRSPMGTIGQFVS